MTPIPYIPKWKNLPVNVRLSKEKQWNLLADVINAISEAEPPEPIVPEKPIYEFTSYDSETKDNEWGTGTAQPTGVKTEYYTQIIVLTNSVEGFEGNKYYLRSNAEPDGTTAYELFTDAGTTSAGIFVTITEQE